MMQRIKANLLSMPSFIKTPHQEKKWNAIKHSVAKQRGKSVADFTDRDWSIVNAAFHKSEGYGGNIEELVKSISTKIPSTSIPNPSKVGSTAVKMPKAKSMPDATDKPSIFFKNEKLDIAKRSSIEKLRLFLEHMKHKK